MQQTTPLARFKLRSKQAGDWLERPSAWMSAAVNQAMRDLDYDRWSQTAYARERVTRRHQDTGDDFRSNSTRSRWGAS